jgi:transcriptional regulator GlxA family with amidase domain
MNGRLQWTQNWKELAQHANWSATALAEKCGVSLRTLERHFLKAMGKRPQTWLCEQRQSRAVELLQDGCNVKKTATLLGYKYATHFSREFKKHWGHAPTENGYDIANNVVPAGNGRKCRDLV